MLTLKKLNREFFKKTPFVMLNKGKDYFYFIYFDGDRHESKMVMVAKVNDLSLDMWMKEFNRFMDEVIN